VKGKRKGVERWSEGLTRGEASRGAGPVLCGQSTDIDSTIFTICKYISISTRFETGTNGKRQSRVSRMAKEKEESVRKHDGLATLGLGKGVGLLGNGKVKTRPPEASANNAHP
jgi:hypothetical protein